jgi:hypothetical protein
MTGGSDKKVLPAKILFINTMLCGYLSILPPVKLKPMKKFTLILAIAAIAVASANILSCKSSGKASAAKLLKFNLEKGRRYDYEIVWDMGTSVMDKKTDISIGAMYSINVTEEKDHVKTMTGTYRNFRMNMDLMGNKIDIDTDKPSLADDNDQPGSMPVGMMNKMFSGIVGKSFTMKVDEEGNILEVSGFEDMINGMVDSIGLDEDKKTTVLASLKDQFNEQEIKNQFSDMFMIFPNKEVKTGDSWERSFTKGGKMNAKFTTIYTVREVEGEQVTLDAKTHINSDGEMNMKGDQTGVLIIDSRTGLMVNGDFKLEIKANTQGFTMLINGKGKIKGRAN